MLYRFIALLALAGAGLACEDDPKYAAPKCSKMHNGVCVEYGESKCAAKKAQGKCTSSLWSGRCPVTCDACGGGAPSGLCEDEAAYAAPKCSKMHNGACVEYGESKCAAKAAQGKCGVSSLWTGRCPKTCGTCGGGDASASTTCEDEAKYAEPKCSKMHNGVCVEYVESKCAAKARQGKFGASALWTGRCPKTCGTCVDPAMEEVGGGRSCAPCAPSGR